MTIQKKTLEATRPEPSSGHRSYSSRTIKILFALSGNRCAVPGCHSPIIRSGTDLSDDLVVGQICHIYAFSEDGPRGKPDLTETEKNSAKNLILCCPTHHVIIDGQHSDYPASLLFDWKRKQEKVYRDRLSTEMNAIGFWELELAARAVIAASGSTSMDIVVVPPRQKIKSNGLTNRVELLLQMGAAKSREVEDVLLKAEQLDPTFPGRLRQGFVAQYESLKREGALGDELFDSLLHWAAAGSLEAARSAAGLCILSHLFVICEVFEK